MHVYEVNIEIRADLEKKYFKWLKDHVVEMLEIKGFLFAEIFKNDNILVRYMIDNEKSFNNYINDGAKQMRGNLPKEFEGQVQITRKDYKHR